MRLLSAIGISVFALSIVVPAYAQDKPEQKQEEKDKPAKENEKKEQPAKPVNQQDEKGMQQPEKNNKAEEKSVQQENNKDQQEQRDAQPRNAQQQNAQPQSRNSQPGQRNAQPSGRIPTDRYQANFGRAHTFRVSQGDFQSGRFQYGGYWFGFGGGWPSNWLYTQDVYVIEINGQYYLCNPVYPGVNLLVNVTL